MDLNRFGIVYELAKEFVSKAIKRFGMVKLYEVDENVIEDSEEEIVQTEHSTLEIIPNDIVEFQKNFLCILKKSKSNNLLSCDEWSELENEKVEPKVINKYFKKANNNGYANYPKAVFEISIDTYEKVKPYYEKIDEEFEKMFSPYVSPYYENVRIENQCYAEYKVLHNGSLKDYLAFLKRNFTNVNLKRTEKILSDNCLIA